MSQGSETEAVSVGPLWCVMKTLKFVLKLLGLFGVGVLVYGAGRMFHLAEPLCFILVLILFACVSFVLFLSKMDDSVLWVIHLKGPCRAIELSQGLSQYSEGRTLLSPGALYPALKHLEAAGLIKAYPGEEKGLHGPIIFFQLTRAGREYVERSKNPFDKDSWVPLARTVVSHAPCTRAFLSAHGDLLAVTPRQGPRGS